MTQLPGNHTTCDVISVVTLVTLELSTDSCVVAQQGEAPSSRFLLFQNTKFVTLTY